MVLELRQAEKQQRNCVLPNMVPFSYPTSLKITKIENFGKLHD